MKKSEAVKLYLKNSRQAKYSIAKIMKFEEGMSCSQYSNLIGNTTNANTYMFADKYGLKFTKAIKHRTNTRRENTRMRITQKWDEKKTLGENAIAIGISYSKATVYRNRFNLDCKWKKRGKATIDRLTRVRRLLDSSLTETEISRVLGLSRERIRQIHEMIRDDDKKEQA